MSVTDMSILTSIIFISVVILVSVFALLKQDVYAVSPSFPTQEVSDSINDWQAPDQWNGNRTLCAMLENETNSPDIDLVKYISDGKTLNATVWLSKAFALSITNLSVALITPTSCLA